MSDIQYAYDVLDNLHLRLLKKIHGEVSSLVIVYKTSGLDLSLRITKDEWLFEKESEGIEHTYRYQPHTHDINYDGESESEGRLLQFFIDIQFIVDQLSLGEANIYEEK